MLRELYRYNIVVDDFVMASMTGTIIDESLLIDKDEVIREKEKEYCISKIKSVLKR